MSDEMEIVGERNRYQLALALIRLRAVHDAEVARRHGRTAEAAAFDWYYREAVAALEPAPAADPFRGVLHGVTRLDPPPAAPPTDAAAEDVVDLEATWDYVPEPDAAFPHPDVAKESA